MKFQGAPPNLRLTYRADIDGLRAVAVLSVAGFHAFPEAIKAGFIGVDIFFVISGFLISTIILGKLDSNKFSVIEFYSGRVRRLFPALLIVLISVGAAGWVTLFAAEYAQLGKHIAAGAGFVVNFVLWADSGYFQNQSATMMLLHLWSLGIEEQFYIVWPLLLWASHRTGTPALATIVAGFILCFSWNIRDIAEADMVAAFYSPQTRGWELLIGAAVASLALRRNSAVDAPLDCEAVRNVCSLVGAALIAAGLLSITKDREFPGWWALLPTAGTALIIAAGSQAWFNRLVLSRRLLVRLGLISYPLYLWHWPLMAYARIVTDGEPSVTVRVGLLALSVVLAWLTYRLLEAPVRFGGRRRLKTVVLLASMALVGVLGYAIYREAGVPSRFASNIDQLVDVQKHVADIEKQYREGTCFLRPEQNHDAFASCDTPMVEGRPSLLLWGDSYAAHLYPGYKAVLGDKYNLIERTASSCRPLVDSDVPGRPFCQQIREYVVDLIRRTKPDKVVLAGQWNWYELTSLSKMIALLKEIGVNDIRVIGPAPEWTAGLPRELFRYWKTDAFHRIPFRMKFGANLVVAKEDAAFADLARQSGVKYSSLYKILCNEDGCLTRFGETSDTLVAWDAGHLTPLASTFVVSRFSDP